MSAKRNCCLFSRVVVWLNAGAIPSVTIACSCFRVHELSYRTSPAKDEVISRHVSRVDHVQTFAVDRSMQERVRCAMAGLATAVRRDADQYLKHDQVDSKWFFQPRQDGWFAMFNGRPNEANAFQHWLSEILT